MARKKKPVLPAAGAAFAFQLRDGRYSVCRVLLDASSKRSQELKGADYILVACSSWIGDQLPRADNPALRPILHLNHHSWKNQPEVLWISDEPPPEFIPIGTIEPTAEEQATECLSFGGWKGLVFGPLAQWRWDHERDAVLAEDAIKEEQKQEAREQARVQRQQHREQITLDQLRGRQFFPNWKGFPSPKARRASRQVMTNTVEELLKLGPRASEQERMAVLERCIESFNDLDTEMQFIETTVREDICEEFAAIVQACGLGRHQDLADRWRDW